MANDTYMNQPHELDWDDEISIDGGAFVLLDEGDYDFTVTAFERGRFPGSREGGKIPECKKVSLTLGVETEEGTANIYYDLILWSTLEWKISEFFRAIGQKKHGEAFRPRWNEVVGSTGRARFKPRKYTNRNGEEKTVNDVVRFYDKEQPQAGKPEPQRPAEQPRQSETPKWQPGKF